MRLNIMKDSERFIGIYDNRIALQNNNGEVRIVSLVDDDGIRVDKEAEIIIGFGDGTVEYGDMDEDIEITTF